MTNRVIAFVCLLGLSGVLGQQDFDYKQPSDYYRGKKGREADGRKDRMTERHGSANSLTGK